MFVLDTGAPVRIVDLATDLIHLSGADPADIEIVFTGLRPGEKMHESLFTEDESPSRTKFAKILMAHAESSPDEIFIDKVDSLLTAARSRDWTGMMRGLQALEPEAPLPPVLPYLVD